MALAHETIAYLNPLGQFAAFGRSKFVRCIIGELSALAPNISKLMIFRNKYTAHRSIDAARGEPEHTRLTHEIGMSPSLFIPRPGAKPLQIKEGILDLLKHERDLFESHYLAFQMHDHEANDWIHFALERDRPVVVQEAFAILKRVISFEPARTADSAPTQ